MTSRMAAVWPSLVGMIVLGGAVFGTVAIDRYVIGLPRASFDLDDEDSEHHDMRTDRVSVPRSDDTVGGQRDVSGEGGEGLMDGYEWRRWCATHRATDAMAARRYPVVFCASAGRLPMPTADGLPTFPPRAACSTDIPPLRQGTRGVELFLADDTLVLRVAVEGGDAILREAPGGYCMLVGPSSHLEVTTMGSWVVYTRDEPGGATLYRTRVDGGAHERIATLRGMPTGVHAFDTSIGVTYSYAAIGQSFAVPDGAEVFEIEHPTGVRVSGLEPAHETNEAIEMLQDRKRRSYTDGEVALLRLTNGRDKIVGTRGAQLCTLVPAGSRVAMARFSGWLYYVRDRVMWRVPVHGGRTERIARVAFQPEWLSARNGDIVGWTATERRLLRSVGDGSPSEADKSGTTCEP